jgi:acyl-CoA thioesterase
MGATLDLTVHFRDHAALDALDASDYVLSTFRTRMASEGFFEEDGEIWSRDGRLIAQSRQLAIATPYSR